MAKKKKPSRTVGAAVQAMPRNTVSLVLDGTVEHYLENYELSLSHFRCWMLCKAAVRVRIGNRLIYTTPIDETFFFCLRYRGRYIVFPIIARMAWLVGFYTANGVFQMDLEDQSCLYMDSDQCEETGFSAGHGTITALTGDTLLGLHHMRDCFDSIADYRGPHHPEPPGFRLAIGTVVVHVMESKFREIFTHTCRGIIDPSFSRLGRRQDFVQHLIVNWSSLSVEGMCGVDNPDYVIDNRGIEKFRTLWDILDEVFFLHVDAYNGGIFLHEPLPPAPRELTWRPIDPGEGDGDIPLPDQRPGARVPRRKCSCVGGAKKDNKRRRRELTGGGAGGAPVVPEWFIQWEQRDDELQCEAVQRHLFELGLHVWQKSCPPAPAPDAPAPTSAPDAPAPAAPAPDALAPDAPAPTPAPDAPAPTSAPDAPAPAAPALDAPAPSLVPASDAPATCDARDPLNLGECVLRLGDLALSGADLHSLEGQNFLLDGVINFVFAQMSATFAQQEDDDIVLVPTGLSSLLANLQDPNYVATSAAPLLLVSGCARLVLFPVNDNDNLDLADGGTHWSLLVLHIAADGSSRFVHHDSMGFGGANLRHARRLVDTLRPLLHGNPPPLMEGFTPRQEAGSNDCGLYVLAVSQAICNWWRDVGRNGSSNSWITAVEADVDAARVQAMRDELLHNFKGQTGADPSSSK